MITDKKTRATNIAMRIYNKQIFAKRKSAVSGQWSVVSSSALRSRGFTLLELLIVVAIMGIVAVAGAGFYGSIIKNVEIESAKKALASDLKSMRSKAMMGALDDNGQSAKWGARIVSTNSGAQYYELFSTPTIYTDGSALVLSTTTLPVGVSFSDPGPGLHTDVIFTRISGTTTPTTISLTSSSVSGTPSTVTVTELGAIY